MGKASPAGSTRWSLLHLAGTAVQHGLTCNMLRRVEVLGLAVGMGVDQALRMTLSSAGP